MKQIRTLFYLTLGLVLAGAGPVAQAAKVGQGYVSAYIGQSDFDFDSADGDDTSFRIGGGYRVNENFAIEGFYIDYGEADDTVNTFFGPFEVSADADAFQFQAVGFLPVNPGAELYAKVGLALWDAKLTLVGFGDDDDDGIDLVFGFGGKFKVSNAVAIRAEYEMADFDDIDITTMMVGVDIGF